MYASLSFKNKKTKKKMHPMANDVRTDILIENFASLELPLPSSFATRTLQINQKINKYTRHTIIHFLCKVDKATSIRFLD